MDKLRIGVIGCGRISERYIDNLVNRFSFCLDVRAVADLLPAAASSRAAQFGVPRACAPEELLADPEIELVVNLTIPAAHYAVSRAALEAGKHVYTEKPLGIWRHEGQELLALALAKGLRIGGAPDTVLGGGIQTCRKLLDDGWIGTPITAVAFIGMAVTSQVYHKWGVGPMLDMGPYFITALVTLLGGVRRVTGSAQTPFAYESDPDPRSPAYGAPFKVETPTTVSCVLDFAGGITGVLTATSEASRYYPSLEIIGTEGTLTCNDPNMFTGPIRVRRRGGESGDMPTTHGYTENSRGLGVADMAYAIRGNRPHRLSAELVYHTLDVMLAAHEASETGQHVTLTSGVERPAALRPGLLGNPLDH
jgi:predicted dehydrogenase